MQSEAAAAIGLTKPVLSPCSWLVATRTFLPAPGPAHTIMFRFDQLIRDDMIIRDVKQGHPKTLPVFEQFNFRPSCDDCDIETVARKNGLRVADVIDALNRAAFSPDKVDIENVGNNE
jgi:hypothetical protein